MSLDHLKVIYFIWTILGRTFIAIALGAAFIGPMFSFATRRKIVMEVSRASVRHRAIDTDEWYAPFQRWTVVIAWYSGLVGSAFMGVAWTLSLFDLADVRPFLVCYLGLLAAMMGWIHGRDTRSQLNSFLLLVVGAILLVVFGFDSMSFGPLGEDYSGLSSVMASGVSPVLDTPGIAILMVFSGITIAFMGATALAHSYHPAVEPIGTGCELDSRISHAFRIPGLILLIVVVLGAGAALDLWVLLGSLEASTAIKVILGTSAGIISGSLLFLKVKPLSGLPVITTPMPKETLLKLRTFGTVLALPGLLGFLLTYLHLRAVLGHNEFTLLRWGPFGVNVDVSMSVIAFHFAFWAFLLSALLACMTPLLLALVHFAPKVKEIMPSFLNFRNVFGRFQSSIKGRDLLGGSFWLVAVATLFGLLLLNVSTSYLHITPLPDKEVGIGLEEGEHTTFMLGETYHRIEVINIDEDAQDAHVVLETGYMDGGFTDSQSFYYLGMDRQTVPVAGETGEITIFCDGVKNGEAHIVIINSV